MDIDLVTTSHFLYHFIVYGWALPKYTEVWKKIMLKCTPKSKMNSADVKFFYSFYIGGGRIFLYNGRDAYF